MKLLHIIFSTISISNHESDSVHVQWKHFYVKNKYEMEKDKEYHNLFEFHNYRPSK